MPPDKKQHMDQKRDAQRLRTLSRITLLIALLLLLTACASRQEMIHDKGHEVMPFSLDETTHVFHKIDNGGLQQVSVKDSQDVANIVMIQQHLYEISQEFSRGDFSDPKHLHGNNMPGIATLEERFNDYTVEYTALDNGAQILYTSEDEEIIEAIHLWFDAQLHDHGHDSTSDFNSDVCDQVPEGHPEDMWRIHHGCV